MRSLTAEETMQRVRRSSLRIEWRRALIPLSLIVMIVLRVAFNAPLWALSLACLWIPIYYIGYPRLLSKRWTAFEKAFALRFQRGEYKQLLELYEGEWFLRRFGPRAEMLGKLGLIFSAMERYREAEQALERAIEEAPPSARDRLYFNLANVKFELGKHEDAEQIYRTLKPQSPYRHAAQTQLALIDLSQGRRVPVARQILQQERKRAPEHLRARIDEALALHP